ncbi:uncharacterized protein LOC132903736 [Amyelois transitella]|uniref:uncharacterized protein LOC132903736 n=1 Tax=Amyelois transitella TaxID=680683 RepID=UPI00298F55B2|nr:uncharacterized protein LOC132903736 [Amyelois transitella]
MKFLGLFFVLNCLLLQDVLSFPLQGLQNNLGNLGLNQGFNTGLNQGLSQGLNQLNQLNFGNNLGLLPEINGLNNINTQTTVLSGTVSQTVAPTYNPGWQLAAAQAPLVTEIVPSLQFGEISLDGDLPVGGSIKISGTFPVYGYVGVDGTIPSYGTAYVDTGNGLIDICKCGL